MDLERWQRVQTLFDEALKVPGAERGALLRQRCGSDSGLYREVEALLLSDAEAGSFIEDAVGAGSVLVTAQREDAPPASHFGKYEVLEKVGQGGFGDVFRSRDPDLERFVAVKTCTSRDRGLRRRFFREARIAAGLQHPNIVTVFDFGLEGEVPYLVQEFLDGEDLDHKISRRDPIPLAERLVILEQIARGLDYAHQRGVLHRDVKPANVRVMEDGTASEDGTVKEGGTVKILDFGIARLLHEESGLTSTGVALGTVGYLAPEQLRGGEPDRRLDVFAFGVLAYELLTGERPFRGATFSEVSYQLLYEEPAPLAARWNECPPEVGEVVERCLAKEPAQRWAGFGEVIPKLEAVRRGAGASSGPFWRPPSAAVAASGSGSVAVAAQLEGATLAPSTPPPGGGEVAARVSRRRLPASLAASALLVALAVWWAASGGLDRKGAESSGLEATEAQRLASVDEADPRRSGTREPRDSDLGTAPDPATVASIFDPTDPTDPADSGQPGDEREVPGIDPRAGDLAQPLASEGERAAAGLPEISAPSGFRSPVAGEGESPAVGPVTGLPEPPARTEADVSQLPLVDREPGEPTSDEGPPKAIGEKAPRGLPDHPILASAAPAPASLSQRDSGVSTEAATDREPASPANAPAYLAPGPRVRAPVLISKPAPAYPRAAKRRRREAKVVVAVLVDEGGRVLQTSLRQRDSSNLGFNEAALEAALKATFQPATRDGVAGRMWTELPFEFRLR